MISKYFCFISFSYSGRNDPGSRVRKHYGPPSSEDAHRDHGLSGSGDEHSCRGHRCLKASLFLSSSTLQLLTWTKLILCFFKVVIVMGVAADLVDIILNIELEALTEVHMRAMVSFQTDCV